MISEKKEFGELTQIKFFLGFIAAVIVVIIFKELKSIFMPLCVAVLLYFFFNGAVKRLVKLKVPQFLVLFFLLVFIFIVFYFLGVLIYYGVSSFIDKFPAYSGKITEMLSDLFTRLKIPIADLNKYLANIDWTKSIDTSVVTTILSTTFGSFAIFIGNLMLVLIFLMFMLAGRTGLTGRINKAFNTNRAEKIKYVINSIEDQVQHYLLIKTFVCFLTAVACGIILFVAGFDLVIFTALLIFVLHYIPNFGSIIVTLFPTLIGILKFGFSLRVLLVVLGLMATQFIIGNVVEPMFTGKGLNLSPIVILISLIFWGYIWGIVGMILAVPLTSAMKIFFENIPVLNPLADIISAE